MYPLLEQLEKEDLVKKREDGRYELTQNAKDELETSFGSRFKKPRSIDGMMDELHGIIAYFEDLRRSGNPELGPHIV